jgi:hypothetical protein
VCKGRRDTTSDPIRWGRTQARATAVPRTAYRRIRRRLPVPPAGTPKRIARVPAGSMDEEPPEGLRLPTKLRMGMWILRHKE